MFHGNFFVKYVYLQAYILFHYLKMFLEYVCSYISVIFSDFSRSDLNLYLFSCVPFLVYMYLFS